MRKSILGGIVGLGLLLALIGGSVAQGAVRVVVVNELLNIRITPAIGAPVIDTVEAGTVFDTVTGRSSDGQWLRVEYQCAEGWINIVPVVILEGDINGLPVADPRSIPFGGFEAPRAGSTSATGPITGVATDGLRMRAGPSTGYPTIGNINFNQMFSITGRNACGNWLQVSFEGTLAWVSATFVQPTAGDVRTLPVGGIIADSAPVSGEGYESYVATLRLMRDRLDIAQRSLDAIRADWTDAALNGYTICQEYPPQPSNISIPSPLLAAYYPTLNPLQTDFNDAMFNVRQAIDLFIQICNLPGTGNPVGQATVQGALGVVNLAEEQFAGLRAQLDELIPDDELGPDNCLLVYNGKGELLPRIALGALYLDEFTRRSFTRGYCFEGIAGQVLNMQALPIPPSGLEIFLSLSTVDDPANFLLVTQGAAGQLVSQGPLTLPRTTTYLLLIADLGGDSRAPIGEYAFQVTDITVGGVAPVLTYDPATASVVYSLVQTAPLQPTLTPAPTAAPPETVCISLNFTCPQFFTCAEAEACYNAGNFTLDEAAGGDTVPGNGVPCDQLCGGGN